LIPTLIGYSIGSYHPIDPAVTVETRITTANAVEFILSDLCVKRLLIFKKYIISISSTHLSDIVKDGLRYSMDHLKNQADTTSIHLLPILHYATIMTKISYHLILSSLSSLVDSKKNEDENTKSQISAAKEAIDHVFELALEYIPLLCNYLSSNSSRGGSDSINGGNASLSGINDNIKTLLGEFYALIVAAQKAHAISFARFLHPFLTLFYSELEKIPSTKGEVEPMFVIPQMTFLANVISCSYYEPDEDVNEAMEAWRSGVNRAITIQGDQKIDPLSVSDAVQNVWTNFLTVERIHNLVDMSIFFMMLNDSHLEEWSENPESFYIERKNVVADDDIISCSQFLYLSMLESKCKPVVLGKLSSIVLNGNEQIIIASCFERGDSVTNETYSNVKFWDALYTIVGLSIDYLKSGFIDINNWFVSSLSQVIKILLEPRENKVCIKTKRYIGLFYLY
jgi:hypothetical protein